MLKQFFGAYFHEDWPLEADSPDGIIMIFLAVGRSSEELFQLADEIESYADEVHDDQALEEALFADLGCYYLPSADGMTARAWLHDVARRLRNTALPASCYLPPR